MIKEFKEFAVKGNMVDMAVAVIMGAAFGAVVNTLVDEIFMPIIGVFLGGLDLSSMRIFLRGDVSINYGMLIMAIINFLIVALCMFAVVKAMNKMKKPVEEEPEAPTQEELLAEIRDLLKEQGEK